MSADYTPKTPIAKVTEALKGPLGTLVRPLALAVVILLATPLLLSMCTVNIEPGEIGVRQNNVSGAGIADRDFGPGYHLRIPGVHRFYTLDERYAFIHFSDDTQLDIRTRDNNVVTLDVSVPFRIRPDEGHLVVSNGLHVGDAYKERTRNVTMGVLREHLAAMNAPEFFDTDRRLEVTEETLIALNEALQEFHVEAERVYIRAIYYRTEYEGQLQRIQLLQQQALLDAAQQEVANRQQLLDNFNQHTSAMENARNAWWDEQSAVLSRVYTVGFEETDLPYLVDASLSGRGIADDPTTEADEVQMERDALTDVLNQRYSAETYRLGIAGIEAETNRRVAEVEGRTSSLQERYQAEADRVIAEIEFDRDRRVNELLSRPGGRALVALEAAERLSFADELVFHADAAPFLFDLGNLAARLMGEGR